MLLIVLAVTSVMAEVGGNIKMSPLEDQIDEKQEPSNIQKFRETRFNLQPAPSEIIGELHEQMWVRIRVRTRTEEFYKHLTKLSKLSNANFKVDCTKANGFDTI